MMNPSCAVIILNYNGKAFLETFLPTVIRHSDNAEIVVADNASTDDSVDFLHKHFPAVRLIHIPENLGFAGGYNYALREIDTNYTVLLNSDVEVSNNWLNPVLDFLEQNAQVAACQPKILSYHQKDTFEYAGAAGGYLDFLGYAFCRGRIFDTCEKDTGQYNDQREIAWATGACLFIRTAIFKDIGGFDDRFFAHYEEIDLCWRIKRTGKQIFYIPNSTVWHVGGGTLHKSNPRKTFLNFRNSLLTLHKNTAPNKRFLLVSLRLILDGISGIKFLFDGSFADVWAILKAHFNFYRLVISTKDPTTKIAGFEAGLFPKSIVWEYFGKGKKTFSALDNS